jgi:hypothetical protein
MKWNRKKLKKKNTFLKKGNSSKTWQQLKHIHAYQVKTKSRVRLSLWFTLSFEFLIHGMPETARPRKHWWAMLYLKITFIVISNNLLITNPYLVVSHNNLLDMLF